MLFFASRLRPTFHHPTGNPLTSAMNVVSSWVANKFNKNQQSNRSLFPRQSFFSAPVPRSSTPTQDTQNNYPFNLQVTQFKPLDDNLNHFKIHITATDNKDTPFVCNTLIPKIIRKVRQKYPNEEQVGVTWIKSSEDDPKTGAPRQYFKLREKQDGVGLAIGLDLVLKGLMTKDAMQEESSADNIPSLNV